MPPRATEEPFLMPVESIWSIKGIGTVAGGKVEKGVIKVNDPLEIIGLEKPLKTTCSGVEMHKKSVGQGEAGDNLGVLVRGLSKNDLRRGYCLVKPGTMK